MKHFWKTLAIGFVAFIIIRFVLNVLHGALTVTEAAIETAMFPINILSTFFGLAVQPSKWSKAGQIVRTASINVKQSNYKEWPDKVDEGFDALSGLATQKPEYTLGDSAQKDAP